MSSSILSNLDFEISQIRNSILDRIYNEDYWKNQHELALRKCLRLNDELKYERYLHQLTKSCRNVSFNDILCDDIIQTVYNLLGLDGTILLRTCKRLNTFKLNLKSVNLNNPIHMNINHLLPLCPIYGCINCTYSIMYIGDCIAGIPHGNGKINFVSNKFIKSELSGNFLKGLPDGDITVSEEEGFLRLNTLIYSTSYSVITLVNGAIDYARKCTIKNTNTSAIYTGDFTLESSDPTSFCKSIICKSGNGLEILGNDTYNGEWHKNKYHGLGKFETNAVLKYSGYWSGGLPFCPEIGMYGDTGTTLLERRLIIKDGIERNYDVLIVNDNKWIAYHKEFNVIKNIIIVNIVGTLEKNEEDIWDWI